MNNDSNVSMPKREQFLAICHGGSPGSVSIIDWLNRAWVETPEEWIKQGAPEEIKNFDFFNQYFQFDHLHTVQEVIVEHNRADLKEKGQEGLSEFYITPPILPIFERRVIKEDERHRIETTYGGQTVMVSKQFPWRMPKYIDHPVKNWDTWNEYKKRLDPHTPERFPSNWNAYVEKTNSEDAPICLLLEGFFMAPRTWMGLENLLYTFHDDPDLVEDMMDQVLYLEMEITRRVARELRIDLVRFSEDMAYKSGPLISPSMFKKFMIPRYKRIADFLHGCGIDVLYVDSDGNINELIPIWLDECGVNFHWPLEVAAGMDAIALRKKYGRHLILAGGIGCQ